MLWTLYLLCCCRSLPDGQHYAPAPVIGALLYPDKPPWPQKVEAAVRLYDVWQQLPPLLCNLLRQANAMSSGNDNSK